VTLKEQALKNSFVCHELEHLLLVMTFEACKGLAEFLGKDVATSQDRPVRVLQMRACITY
jgi:hypothetical protein